MNTDIATTTQLTSTQARRLCEKIASAVKNLGELLWELRERKGWLALGYASWNECCETEFKYSKRHANRLIEATTIKEQVGPTGPTLNERQARELSSVPEEKHQDVIDWATEKADGKPLTAKAIRQAAEEVLEAEPLDDEEDEPTIPKPNYEMTEQFALEAARCAITQLEQIKESNPGREKALWKVMSWVQDHLWTEGSVFAEQGGQGDAS
jgi:hypothetical protein